MNTLDQIEAEGPSEDQPRFEQYSIRGIRTATEGQMLISTLQPLVPTARLSIDADNNKLIAWGTPDPITPACGCVFVLSFLLNLQGIILLRRLL